MRIKNESNLEFALEKINILTVIMFEILGSSVTSQGLLTQP